MGLTPSRGKLLKKAASEPNLDGGLCVALLLRYRVATVQTSTATTNSTLFASGNNLLQFLQPLMMGPFLQDYGRAR
jgi:hypothetical protein